MTAKYFVEVGVLLDENNEEFEQYNIVYDHKYGYYDENQYFSESFNKAKKEITEYVQKGIKMTYGIISNNDITRSYFTESIIYSIMKDNSGNIIENFIKKGE